MWTRKLLARTGFTKIDNSLWFNLKLSSDGLRLYGALSTFQNFTAIDDGYLCTALGMSIATLTRKKKELKDMDLICTVCICPRVYVLYIGSVNFPASAVSKHFEAEDRKRLGR